MPIQAPSLDVLEQRTYRTAVDHGFFDLLLAAAVAVFALVFTLSQWFVLALFPLVLAKQPLLKLFNRRVVEPRAGHVRLSPMRLEQISTARKAAALAVFGLAFIVARLGDMDSPIVSTGPMAWLAETPQFQMAIIVGVGTAAAGWLLRLPRFISYGLLIVLTPLLAAITGLPAGIGWITATLLISAAGCRVLYQFVGNNPETGA
ncbi:MAG: hypothetical protein RQ741_06760 [Wenzhouxiangellaceae bacterium]|nr:hypothetical protein [Wenzhouxiangellaceae bacterium]